MLLKNGMSTTKVNNTLTRELGEPCHPRTAVLAFVGGGLRYAELTVVSVRQCE